MATAKNWGVFYCANSSAIPSRRWVLDVHEKPFRFTREAAELYATRQNRSATAGTYHAAMFNAQEGNDC